MRRELTLKGSVEFEGKGLHSGHISRIILKPAPEDTGIVFISKSGSVNQFIPYSVENVVDTRNNISISNGRALIKTVEHLVSTLYALHIDNCIIECFSNEIPILDGSAGEFVKKIIEVGIVEQNKNREEFRIINPIWSTLDDKYIVALPYNGLKCCYTISFPNSPIGTQTYTDVITSETFIKSLATARTFGFLEDLENYQKNGLVLGVSIDNVNVYSRKDNKAVNSPRYNDEPVRHKMLDLIGGLALLNFDIKGFIIAYKAGHTLDVMFAKKVMNIYNGINQLYTEKPYRVDTNFYIHATPSSSGEKMPS